MDDFLVRIRLEALKNILVRIRMLSESVSERREDINNLRQSIDAAGQKLNKLRDSLAPVLSAADPAYGDSRVHPSLNNFLGSIDKEGKDLGIALKAANVSIETITQRWTPIEKVEAMVRDTLDTQIADWIKRIDIQVEALKTANASSLNTTVADAWKEHDQIINEQMRLFSFSDYVEFLGGLALRDAGLDQGVCRIADELISSFGQIGRNWNALAIPASQEAVTLVRSIRMGFPEWTLWAVPLTAHELGHLEISGNKRKLVKGRNNTKWERYIFSQIPGNNKRSKKEQQHMLIYLADALATCAMGPAYACSAILLRFNSRSAYTESDKYPPDAKRAYVILDMLARMVNRLPLTLASYSKTLAKLEAGWHDALGRMKTNVLPPADQIRLQAYNKYMFDELPSVYYTGSRLDNARSVLDSLLKNQDPPANLQGEEEGRDVLNAAWECRLEGKYELSKIEDAAQKLWDLIIEERRKRAAQLKLEPYPRGRGMVSSVIPGKTSWTKIKES